jgi:succinate dehydrogenase flavin-adding protein (antitoxin of CptAB toxin-antitoxin module)
MREMDELLLGFHERYYASAPEPEKAAFRRLLELPDPELIGYLLGGIDAADPELAHVAQRIRSGTRTG